MAGWMMASWPDFPSLYELTDFIIFRTKVDLSLKIISVQSFFDTISIDLADNDAQIYKEKGWRGWIFCRERE